MKKTLPRVSLAELQRKDSRSNAGTSAQIDEGASPSLRELTEALMFSPGDGRIWLNDQRMVLWRSSTYGALRRELIASMGQDLARSLLTRVGYMAGSRDAELVRKTWPDSDPANAFQAGPRMHSLEGIVRPVTNSFEFDIERGDFHADFDWHDSSEDDEHISAFGIGTEAACWMQIGYASGYASAFMGKMIIYREVACRSMGDPVCRIIGKPADQWADPEIDFRYFAPETSAQWMRAADSAGAQVALPAARVADDMPTTEEPIGISAAFSAARHLIERVAPTRASVLFSGASGVGKEMFAQTLHRISPRRNGPFIAINCAAIPETLVEAELFGVEKGAYTGAAASRPGRIERAHGGTLFLDEIASLSYVAQGKFLRALQERVVERVGGTSLIPVDVRLVAATNVDLRDEVKAGRFREDLFFRLNVFPILLPPLVERRDDIPLLMDAFLRRYSALHARPVPGFTPRAIQALLKYDFPGNIRELQNLIERGVILVNPGEAIDVHHLFRGGELHARGAFGLTVGGRLIDQNAAERALSANIAAPPPDAVAHQALASTVSGRSKAGTVDIDCYQEALQEARYNVADAARTLGLTRAQLAYRLKKAGIT